MDWLRFLLIALAAFTAWEWVLVALPFVLPAALQPLAVAGLAYGAQRIPEPYLGALAAAGAVALLHLLVRGGEGRASAMGIPRRHPATGRRVPDLP